MKLGGLSDGTVYASGCRTVYREAGELNFQQVGQLPTTVWQTDSATRVLQTNCVTKALLTRLFGFFPTTNLWPVTTDRMYATRGNQLLRTVDGEAWTCVHQLPSSSGPMGVLPTGFCVAGEALYIGEYPLNSCTQPRVLRSIDDGETWTTVATPPARHIHAVTLDPFTGDCWVTTGDSDDESMIGRLTTNGIEIIGTGSQLWRAVDLVFTPESILWGIDCPYAEKNRIVRLNRNDIGANEPSVETLQTVRSPVYFADAIELDGEYHIFFSTAVEPAVGPKHTAQILYGSSIDGFETWQTLASYEKQPRLLDAVIDTNAYVFLATHPERGLFFNPYNTQRHGGEIHNIPINRFQSLED